MRRTPAAVLFSSMLACGDTSTDASPTETDTDGFGVDSDTDTSNDEVDTEQIVVNEGDVFGPCLHDDEHTLYWCTQVEGGTYPVLCSTPQEIGKPHASICVERHSVYTCPDQVLLQAAGPDDWQLFDVSKGYGGTCRLACTYDDDCPSYPTSMTCASNICAWQTF